MRIQHLTASALAVLMAFSPLAAQAQLFGESDEVKAARQAHEDAQDAQIAQAQARLQQLEDRLRGLTESLARSTGTNEELAHQIEMLNQKIESQNRDFTYRVCMLSAQQLGADPNTFNCGNTGAGSGAAPAMAMPQQVAPGAALPPIGGEAATAPAPQMGRAPGILGTLPSGPSASGAPAQLSRAAPLPPPAAASQFDTGMNLLARAQYAEASAAFRAYADSHPEDQELSPQAIYWIGDIDYVRQDYPSASRGFAELIKKYPKSQRAPDAMLKLGQSLLAMGQKPEGCTTLGALKAKFPDASDGTIAAAATARKAAACR
jgi:tol-pal system protein YbgF